MRHIILSNSVSAISLSLLLCTPLVGQSDCSGFWSGTLMEEFSVEIRFSSEEGEWTGRLKLYRLEEILQDDALTDIEYTGDTCRFYIPAKNTHYSGTFDESGTQLSGYLTFPDGSLHALNVSWQDSVATNAELFARLRKRTFTAQALQEDLAFLYTTLQTEHPQPYLNITEDSFSTLYHRLSSNVQSDLSLLEFYRIATQLIDAVKCSHTGLRITEQDQQLIEHYSKVFPLELFFKDDKAFYIRARCGVQPALQPGVEILKINQNTVADLIDRIFMFIPTESNGTTTEYLELNDAFSKFLYYIDMSDTFSVSHRSGTSTGQTFLHACPSSAIEQEPVLLEPEFSYLADQDAGVMRIPSFGIHDMEDYLAFLDSVFTMIRSSRINSLVVDLRGNGGGHPIFAAQLLSYLTDHEFTYFVRNAEITDFEPLYHPMPANPLHFSGDLYVLVDGGCLSTTGHLISLLEHHTNAVFIGEQPGSTYRCNDFSMQARLPHTGLELNVPRTIFQTAVIGFIPGQPFPLDVEIEVTVKDVVAGDDPYLRYLEKELREHH